MYQVLERSGDIMKGYIQVYTGDGKGKTTAALGLALRAAGAGLKVYIAQFIKTGEYSEIRALKRFSDRITVEQFGTGKFVIGPPDPEEIQSARTGLERAEAILRAGKHDLVVLDEANVAVACGLFALDELLGLIRLKPESTELVITGRQADPRLLEQADLVSEIKAVKHYYSKGVDARVGIEK